MLWTGVIIFLVFTAYFGPQGMQFNYDTSDIESRMVMLLFYHGQNDDNNLQTKQADCDQTFFLNLWQCVARKVINRK